MDFWWSIGAEKHILLKVFNGLEIKFTETPQPWFIKSTPLNQEAFAEISERIAKSVQKKQRFFAPTEFFRFASPQFLLPGRDKTREIYNAIALNFFIPIYKLVCRFTEYLFVRSIHSDD